MTDIEEIARAMAAAHGLDWDGKYKATEYANHGWWLKCAEAVNVILDCRIAEARAAGAAEMQERCAGVAERHNAATAVIAPKIRSLT